MANENANFLKLPEPMVLTDSFFRSVEQSDNEYNRTIKSELSFKHVIDKQKYNTSDLESSFLDSDFSASKTAGKEILDYSTSPFRIQSYREVSDKDKMFNFFLRGSYGNVETFFDMSEALKTNKVYNPAVDYQVEVGIITKDSYFKSNFISTQEVILENISGICTIEYLRVDGRADKMITSLQENLVPQSQESVRMAAFGSISGKYGQRVLVWNLLKGGWSSFYMGRLIRFIRDDTTGLE